ncbi:ATP-dependent Clp protease proteolytic subunit [Undibacterium sp. Ji83W]|uniref:ATP-dependent Clp protease proteolytic subunit n=1 Tax=Undibacterium sp. Ji83W TaxID=3413043 RepID=UPI003BF045E4
MIKFTRLTNLLLMMLLGLVALLQITGKSSDKLDAFFPSLPGLLMLLSVYIIPWYALGSNATPRLLRFARGYMAFTLIFSIGVPVGMTFSANVGNMSGILMTILLAGLPGLLSFKVLSQKMTQLHASFSSEAALTEPPLQPGLGNYFKAHWRGQLSLGKSFWVNGVGIGNLLAAFMITGLTRLVEASDVSLRMLASISTLGFGLAFLLWLWAVIGIIRSASKHSSRGGSGIIAGLAMLMALFNILGVLVNASSSFVPQIKEFAQIASGHDKMKHVEISSLSKGDTLQLRGTIGEGSVASFVDALKKYPQVKTISLNSPGGRLREAQQIATLIKARQLNTYVEGECSSACTYIFLAGHDRAATPNAHIGFHQPSFPGMDGAMLAIATDSMAKHYRAANLPEDFIRIAINTKAEGMWYPSREEMVKARVITRVSLGGEANALFDMQSREEVFKDLSNSTVWRNYERRAPGKIEQVTNLIWSMKLAGKDSQTIQDAVKLASRDVYLLALKSAPDDLLDEYAQLLSEQLEAARQIGPQACALLIKGTLNTQRTMPENLIKRDSVLLEKIMASEPRSRSYIMASKEFARSAKKLQDLMSPLQRQITANLDAYANQPILQCEGVIGLYRNILHMQDVDRHIILSALVQAK